MATTIDVPAWLEQQKVSRTQILVLVLMTFTTAVDGFDAQMIGYVAPAVIRQFKVLPHDFTAVFALGLTGMLVGSLVIAPLADWIGRRRVLLGSCFFFGVMCVLTAWADSLRSLMVLRFLTGLGLGGSMANAIALTAEYFPARNRAFATMAMFCGFALGATLGGFLAAGLMARFGWPSVFLTGGTLALVLAVALAGVLPESLRYLVLKNGPPARIAAVLQRINPGTVFPVGTRFVVHEEQAAGITVRHLFREGRGLGTILLWIIFFCSLLDIFFLASWLPTVLHDAGLSISVAVIETALFQGGGVVAGLTLGLVIDRAGFLKVLVPVYLGAGIAIAALGFAGTSPGLIMLASFLAGAFVIGGQNSMNVLAAVFYPTYIRATGIGWALGIGRFGSIVGPIVGGILLHAQWGRSSLFMVAAVPAFVAAIAAVVLSLTQGEITAKADTAVLTH